MVYGATPLCATGLVLTAPAFARPERPDGPYCQYMYGTFTLISISRCARVYSILCVDTFLGRAMVQRPE